MQDVNDDSRDAITRQARNALGSRLREIRESRGMTQTAVARQAGLSRSYYAQVEHARQAISVDRAFPRQRPRRRDDRTVHRLPRRAARPALLTALPQHQYAIPAPDHR